MRHRKDIGHIMRMYGSQTGRFTFNQSARYYNFNFENIERRMLGMYAGYDPYNHFGKYALGEPE